MVLVVMKSPKTYEQGNGTCVVIKDIRYHRIHCFHSKAHRVMTSVLSAINRGAKVMLIKHLRMKRDGDGIKK